MKFAFYICEGDPDSNVILKPQLEKFLLANAASNEKAQALLADWFNPKVEHDVKLSYSEFRGWIIKNYESSGTNPILPKLTDSGIQLFGWVFDTIVLPPEEEDPEPEAPEQPVAKADFLNQSQFVQVFAIVFIYQHQV